MAARPRARSAYRVASLTSALSLLGCSATPSARAPDSAPACVLTKRAVASDEIPAHVALVPSSAPLPEGARVQRVRLVGARGLPLDSLISSAPGLPLDRARIARDLSQLMAAEALASARADVQRTEQGLELVYTVQVRPRLTSVHTVGLSMKDVALPLPEAGELHDPTRDGRLARELERQLRHRGHLDSRVEVGHQESDDGVQLCFAVSQGPRVVLTEVRVEGNEAISDELLLSRLRTHDGAVNVVGGVPRLDLLEQELPVLLSLYYDRGHIQATIEPELSRGAEPRAVLVLRVDEGAVYRLGMVKLAGELSHLRSLVDLQRGEVFDRSKISRVLARLQSALSGGTVTPETQLDEAAKRVDLTLRLSP